MQAAAPGGLGLVECPVGPCQQWLNAGVNRPQHGQASAEIDLQAQFGRGRLPQALAQPLVERCAGRCVAVQQQAELLAAQARGQVAVAARFLEQAAEQLQSAVAHFMAMGVVHLLEMIQIEHEGGERQVMAPGVRQHGLGALLEAAPVGQAGQRVGDGQLAQLELGLVAPGHQQGDGVERHGHAGHQRKGQVDRVGRAEVRVLVGEGAQNAAPQGQAGHGQHARKHQPAPAGLRWQLRPQRGTGHQQRHGGQQNVGPAHAEGVAVEAQEVAQRRGHGQHLEQARPGPGAQPAHESAVGHPLRRHAAADGDGGDDTVGQRGGREVGDDDGHPGQGLQQQRGLHAAGGGADVPAHDER